ncbi:unnamed protein product [Trifolium pratense]|uniref:Uncharacterized protein n=1 Tax=Trifolium pratense TaxID=57577 RepID=A0ACB0KX03_TRIPR|nr:unnamed protein product [Trifolium pratense]
MNPVELHRFVLHLCSRFIWCSFFWSRSNLVLLVSSGDGEESRPTNYSLAWTGWFITRRRRWMSSSMMLQIYCLGNKMFVLRIALHGVDVDSNVHLIVVPRFKVKIEVSDGDSTAGFILFDSDISYLMEKSCAYFVAQR